MREKGIATKAIIGIVVVIVAVASVAYVLMAPSDPSEPTVKTHLKMALIIEVPEYDFAWGQINSEALDYMQDYFAAKDIEIEIAESYLIPPPEFGEEARIYIEEGYEFIWIACDGHGPELYDVALDFPNVYFSCAATLLLGDMFPLGTPPDEMVIPPNLAVIDHVAFTCNHYLSGMIAGGITQTDKIGFIGGVEYPSIHRKMRAMQQGVLRVNPNADVSQYVWAGSWIDIAKGKEIAEAMHEYGCDVIMTYADGIGTGAMTYASDAGGPPWMFGAMWPIHTIYPEVDVADGVENLAPVLIGLIERILEDRWDEVGGEWTKIGYTPIDKYLASPIGPVINPALKYLIPDDILELVETVEQEIRDGTFEVPKITE